MSFRKQWTAEHGADGLRGKFAVYKRAARTTWRGTDTLSCADRIGEDGEFIFVLRPCSDEAAWQALHRYAVLVEARAPQLAEDILTQLAEAWLAQVPA